MPFTPVTAPWIEQYAMQHTQDFAFWGKNTNVFLNDTHHIYHSLHPDKHQHSACIKFMFILQRLLKDILSRLGERKEINRIFDIEQSTGKLGTYWLLFSPIDGFGT